MGDGRWRGEAGGGERELRDVVMRENEGRLVKDVVWVREMGGGSCGGVVGGGGQEGEV